MSEPKFITVEEATDLMTEAGYSEEDLTNFRPWHNAGRWVLIFENHDLGHPHLGHKVAMPWDEDVLPPFGPDHPSIGMGWRYLTTYAVRPKEGLDESETTG